jgi:hypothetical protein
MATRKITTNAMYQILVVDPLVEIVKDLEGGFTYRLEWLDEKLDSYMKIAATTAGLSASLVSQQAKPTVKNEYAKTQYLKYFTALLDYFTAQK